MRLKPGVPIVSLPGGAIQLGTAPPLACRLEGLTRQQRNYIHALGRAKTGTKRRRALPQEDYQQIWGLLSEANMVWHGRTRPAGTDQEWWVRQEGSAKGVQARAYLRTRIEGLDPLGAHTAVLLSKAGFLRIDPKDPAPVSDQDVGLFYRSEDVGSPRAQLVRQKISPTTMPFRGPANFAILISSPTADASRALPYMFDGIPHLLVTVLDTSIEVGPLVMPSASPCINCVDIAKQRKDPLWANLKCMLGKPLPQRAESILTFAVGAFIVRQAADLARGRIPDTVGATWTFTTGSPIPTYQHWQVEPRCGCGASLQPSQ